MGAGAAIGALFGGGAMGGISSALGALLSYNVQKKLMQKQYDLNQQAIKAYYGANRYSLEHAGYNPLLGIPGSTAQGFTASTTGANVDFAGAVKSGIDAVNSAKQVQNETKATESQVNVNSADQALKEEQARTEQAKREQMAIDNLKTKAETTLTDKESSWYDKRQAKELDKIVSDAEFNRGMLEVNKYNSETQRMEYYNNLRNAKSNEMNARTNSAVGASQSYRNYNASLGYSTTVSGPFGVSVSHTGNPNKYTKGEKNPKYQDEYINGKKVRVRVF